MDSCGCIRPIKKRVQMGFWRVKKKVSYTQDVRSADFPPEQISPGCNEVWELVGEIGYYYSSDNGMQSTFVTTGNLFWIRLDCKILFTSFPVLLHPPHRSSRLDLVWIGRLVPVVLSRLSRWWFRARVRPPASCRSYLTGSLSFQDLVSSSCKLRCPTARCSGSSSHRWLQLLRPRQAQVW